MKKIIFLAIVVFIIGLSLPFFALAAEKISSFDAVIKINQDASVDASEKIKYDFGNIQRHGIFRTIPVKYKARGGNYNLRISNIKVTNEKGAPYNFQKSFPGKDIEIKIGDSDKFITGEKTYIINYKIKRAINYFKTHDELYWNITGNEWPVEIGKSSVLVILPEEINNSDLQLKCFAGSYDSSAGCSEGRGVINGNEVYFSQSKLSAGEGMTIVVGFPKNLITEPSRLELIWETLKDNWILFLPFITFTVLFYLWRTRGRDPQGCGTIIAQFGAPDKLTPAEAGTIIDEKVHSKDITAEIINLAVKGYLKITRLEKNILFFKSADYLLEKLKEENNLENEYEKILLKSLFKNKKAVKLSSLADSFYKNLEKIKKELYETTVRKGYFNKNPKKVRNTYIAVGVTMLCSSWLMAIVFGGLGVFSFIVSGLLIIIFGLFMPAKTKKGILAKEHILGFKKYLSVAEKDRIDFHNKPQKNPRHFEKLLPYAMALGVEEEWAKQFEGIYDKQPDWYSGPNTTSFNALALTHSLNSFSSSAKSTLASSPSSASGGGSGFSGGGSGGGFGGGGGGSW